MRLYSLVFWAFALWHRAEAQCQEVTPAQYAGTPFANSLHTTSTQSNITYFKIRDPTGQHVCTSDAASDLSFLTYVSLNSTLQRVQDNAIKRLIIVVSGANADAWNYHKDMIDALNAMKDTNINTNNILIVSPYFPNDNHAGTGFPYNASGTTADQKYPSAAMVWYGTEVSKSRVLVTIMNVTDIPIFSGLEARTINTRLVSRQCQLMMY